MPPTPVAVRLRNFVGDVVLSVPTLQRLSDAGFALHLVGKGWARPLLEGFGWPVQALAPDLPGRVRQWRALRRELRGGGATLPPEFLALGVKPAPTKARAAAAGVQGGYERYGEVLEKLVAFQDTKWSSCSFAGTTYGNTDPFPAQTAQ